MATAAGVLQGMTLISSDWAGGGRKTYLCTFAFPAYTGSTDTATIIGPAALIKGRVKNGKSMALIASDVPVCTGPGYDTNSQAVYIGAVTISTADLTFSLTIADGSTEITTSTACSGVQLAITIQES